MLWMRINKESKGKSVRMSEVVRTVASDLSDLWVFGLNIYPCSLKGIRVKLEAIYKEFTRIRDYPKSKRGDKYNQTLQEFNTRMLTGFDIRTMDMDRLKDLEDYYMVKMKDEDLLLWEHT